MIAEVAGTRVLLCSVRGTLYAYRDACAACGISLAEGTLTLGRTRLPRLPDPVRRPVRGPQPRRRRPCTWTRSRCCPTARESGSRSRRRRRRSGREPAIRAAQVRRAARPGACPGCAGPRSACPGPPRSPGPARPGSGRAVTAPAPRGRRRGTLRVLRHRHTAGARSRGGPGAVQPGLRLPGLLPAVHPAAQPGAAGTAPSRTAICGIRPGRCPPWSGTSCRSRSGWRSS